MTSTATLHPPPRKCAPAAGLFGAMRVLGPSDLPVPANERERSEFFEDFITGTPTRPAGSDRPR